MKKSTVFQVPAVVLMSWFLCVTSQAAEFLYTGDEGPGFWAELDPAWEACEGAGGRQSPIDINNVVIDPTLKPLNLALEETPIQLINNGHAIEQEYEHGSTLTFGGVVYDLLQFHFHTLSEHTLDGQHGVMELHAVFRNTSSGNLAVIGMLYSIGKENPFLQELIDAGLPEKENDVVTGLLINLADGLTNNSSYYTYLGSLTTPPCSEIVTWIVLKRTAEMSAQQFQAFRHILGNDFRPLQERNDRVIRATVDGPVVIFPNGPGIELVRGNSYDILWDGFKGSRVKIQLFRGESYVTRITDQDITPNDGLYSWVVPTWLKAGSNYRVKVISASDSSQNDFSDNFFTIK